MTSASTVSRHLKAAGYVIITGDRKREGVFVTRGGPRGMDLGVDVHVNIDARGDRNRLADDLVTSLRGLGYAVRDNREGTDGTLYTVILNVRDEPLGHVIRYVTGRPGWSVKWMEGVTGGPDVRYRGSCGYAVLYKSGDLIDASAYYGASSEGGREARYCTTPAQAAAWAEKKLGASSTPFKTHHLHYADGQWRPVLPGVAGPYSE